MVDTTRNTKDRLLDAAQVLIQTRGVNAMSFQDLSDAVGIRKASVHHHFASKAEMVCVLTQRYLSEFDGVLNQILRSRVSGKTKLKRYCNLFVETLKDGQQDKGCLCGMLIAEMHSLDDEGLQLVQQFVKSNLDFLQSILTEGVSDGSILKQASNKGTAHLVLSTLEGGLLIARCGGGPKQLADTTSRLLSFLSA
ncbi:TetR/AcrR family transcriptional regulator [bacterium]|nr:TetR/AcrR family transcriptional regulator [bacterium]